MPTYAQIEVSAIAALAAGDIVGVWEQSLRASSKLDRNCGKAVFLHYSPGRADEAHHYSEKINSVWRPIVRRIHTLAVNAVAGMSEAEQGEIVIAAARRLAAGSEA